MSDPCFYVGEEDEPIAIILHTTDFRGDHETDIDRPFVVRESTTVGELLGVLKQRSARDSQKYDSFEIAVPETHPELWRKKDKVDPS